MHPVFTFANWAMTNMYIRLQPLFALTGENLVMPYARTVLGVLKGAMRLVGDSGYLTPESPALQSLRESAKAVCIELEQIAEREPRAEFESPSEEFLRMIR